MIRLAFDPSISQTSLTQYTRFSLNISATSPRCRFCHQPDVVDKELVPGQPPTSNQKHTESCGEPAKSPSQKGWRTARDCRGDVFSALTDF